MDVQAEESYKELLRFLRYYRNFGTPIIIGGWAVYFYNPYFGSVDIDVVGSSMGGAFHDALDSYVHANGYSLVPMDTMGLQLAPVKEIRKKGTVIANVELDAATFEDPAASKFHEDNKKEYLSLFAGKKNIEEMLRWLKTAYAIFHQSSCYCYTR